MSTFSFPKILNMIKNKIVSTDICICVNTYYCRNIKVLCPCCFFGTCIEVVAVSAKQRHLPSSSNHASRHFQRQEILSPKWEMSPENEEKCCSRATFLDPTRSLTENRKKVKTRQSLFQLPATSHTSYLSILVHHRTL